MKDSLGKHIPDLFVPPSAGGQFQKAVRPAERKRYICMTTAGLMLVVNPFLKTSNGETTPERVREGETRGKGEKQITVTQVLCGPFYPDGEKDVERIWKENIAIAKERQRNWPLASDGRDGMGMIKIEYARMGEEEEKKETENEWDMPTEEERKAMKEAWDDFTD